MVEGFFLDKDFIQLDVSFKTQNEIFENIGKELVEKNYVVDSYIEEIKKREQEFPTGITTEKFAIAIPHVDSKYVKVNTLFVLTSKDGIEFEDAENDGIIKSKIIFGILIKDHNSHIDFLVKISNLIQNSSVLSNFYLAKNKEEIINLLSEEFKLQNLN